MGMTRRLNTYDNPEWDPYLAIALFGAVLVAIGIACFLMQIIVGFLQRKDNMDLTGDPWDARTLEWATSSPARSITLRMNQMQAVSTVSGLTKKMV